VGKLAQFAVLQQYPEAKPLEGLGTLSFPGAMGKPILLAAQLFTKLAGALLGHLVRVETREIPHGPIMVAAVAAVGLTAEQAELMALHPHFHLVVRVMAAQVETLAAEAVPVERVVLAQQVQGLWDLRAQTAVAVAVAVLIQVVHMLL
jgi:hypothetical protein